MAGNIRIYQNYYSESHTTYLDPSLTPHDARASLQPDLYEVYWLVSLFENGCYLEQEYTGLVSWKFGQKTGISGRRAIEFITEHPGYDVYLINPFPELAYLFFNVWECGERWHPGITGVAQDLLERAGYDISLDRLGRNKPSSLLYCNYWVGNARFWENYLSFLAPLYELASDCSSNPPLGLTTHHGVPAPFFPFVFERLFSTYLLANTHAVSSCHYRYARDDLERRCHDALWAVLEPFVEIIDEMDSMLSEEDYSVYGRRLFPAICRAVSRAELLGRTTAHNEDNDMSDVAQQILALGRRVLHALMRRL